MEPEKEKEEKTYLTSKKKWGDFDIHPDIIEVLKFDNKFKPTRIQQETLTITTNADRKKYSMIIRSSNGSGKTLTYLIPILNSLQPGKQICRDKTVGTKVQKNEIFLPQGVILIQTGPLAQQIENELEKILKIASRPEMKSNKLNFTIGRMEKELHKPGDIILTKPKSFINRFKNKSLKLDQCHFIAIDEVDEIYEQAKDQLKEILEVAENAPNVKLLVCSATMKNQFKQFFNSTCKNGLQINLNDILREEVGHSITLEGVKNYLHILDGNEKKYDFILNEVFKELYDQQNKIKPRVFIFFNTVDEIYKFKDRYEQFSYDLSNPNSKYLKSVSLGIVAANKIDNDGKRVEVGNEERRKILTDFRNNQFQVLLATNIVARGIDIRDVCFVINVDAPREGRKQQSHISVDTYLHRVGRTGRHSDQGVALTLVDASDEKYLVDTVKKVHKVEINKFTSLNKVVEQVHDCIENNSSVPKTAQQPK